MIRYNGQNYPSVKRLLERNNPHLSLNTFNTRLRRYGKDEMGIRKALSTSQLYTSFKGAKPLTKRRIFAINKAREDARDPDTRDMFDE